MDLATNGSSSKASSLPHTVGESTIGAGAGAGAGHSSRSSRRRSVSGLPPRPSPSMSTNPGYVGYTTRAQTPANDDFAVSKSAPNSANNSTNNSTTTGASSTKGGRKTPKHPGTKSRRKSTKSNTPNIIPTHLLGNLTEGVPSYQNIINMNTSLVPNSSNSQTDGNNNRSFGNAGFTGTDVGAYSIPVRNPIDLNSSHLSHGSQPSSRYSQAGDFAPSMSSPGLSTLPADPPAGASASHYPQQHQQYSVPSSAQPFRRPPRHPVGTVPSSTSSTRRVTATIPSVHPTAYADPNGYVPPAGYSLVPDAPSSGTPRRPSTASNTGARATTASSRASASKASTSSSGRKSPGLIRRMPGSSNNYNNNNNNNSVASPHPSAVTAGVAPRTAKTRSHSAPPVRHVPVSASKPVGVSTFGNASRNL